MADWVPGECSHLLAARDECNKITGGWAKARLSRRVLLETGPAAGDLADHFDTVFSP
jgi:hypothetical protein